MHFQSLRLPGALCSGSSDRVKWHSQFLCSRQDDSCLSSSVGGQPTSLAAFLAESRWEFGGLRLACWRLSCFGMFRWGATAYLLHVALCPTAPLVSGSSAFTEILDYRLSFSAVECSEPSAQVEVRRTLRTKRRNRGRGMSQQKAGKATAPRPLVGFENKSTLT